MEKGNGKGKWKEKGKGRWAVKGRQEERKIRRCSVEEMRNKGESEIMRRETRTERKEKKEGKKKWEDDRERGEREYRGRKRKDRNMDNN